MIAAKHAVVEPIFKHCIAPCRPQIRCSRSQEDKVNQLRRFIAGAESTEGIAMAIATLTRYEILQILDRRLKTIQQLVRSVRSIAIEVAGHKDRQRVVTVSWDAIRINFA